MHLKWKKITNIKKSDRAKMVYGIVNIRTKKRVRLPSGKLSDVYKYPYEAQKVIENVLGNSPYITVKRLGGK